MSDVRRKRTRLLSIEVDPELRERITMAAAERQLSVGEYVAGVLRDALALADGEQTPDEASAWHGLSAASFGRHWISKEDDVYNAVS